MLAQSRHHGRIAQPTQQSSIRASRLEGTQIAVKPLAFCASLSTVRLAGNGLKQLHCSVAVLPSLSLLDVSQNNAIVICTDTQSSQQCDDPVSQPPTKAKSGNLGVLDNFRTRRERGSAEDDQVPHPSESFPCTHYCISGFRVQGSGYSQHFAVSYALGTPTELANGVFRLREGHGVRMEVNKAAAKAWRVAA
eukprot:2321101-Rhodomonas_salina.6